MSWQRANASKGLVRRVRHSRQDARVSDQRVSDTS